jgi:DNA-binding NarL/FixJ family response regulator
LFEFVMSERILDLPIDLPDDSVQALVVDAHPLTRIGLGVLLQRQPWVARCRAAADRDEAVALAERHRPDVAVVDVSAAGPFVGSYLAPLRAAHPAMPLVLSSHYAPANHAHLLAAGASGLLTPDLTMEQMLSAVRSALVGERVALTLGPERTDQLSEREREVLALLCTGATNREIAQSMHVGTETVKKHAGALYRKLGVRNRTEAAQRAAALLAAA